MWTRIGILVLLAGALAPPESIAQHTTPDYPGIMRWKTLKGLLTAADGQNYFDMNLKGALLPPFRGIVIRLDSRTSPTMIVLAVEDGVTPDATIRLGKPLKGNFRSGMWLSFEGVPQSYTGDPFMIVFDVDAAHLHGWPPPLI